MQHHFFARSSCVHRTLLSLFAVACLTGCEAKEGGFCLSEGKSTCSTDHKEFGTCVNRKWAFVPCGGPKGCGTSGDQVICDQSVAKDKDKCSTNDTAACSTDKKQYLKCSDHVFQQDMSCKGPKGCFSDAGKIYCDQSLADEGDECTTEGVGTCSVDSASLLECKSGHLALTSKCRGPKACRYMGTSVHCDWSVGVAGEPCSPDGLTTCTADHKSRLVCRKGDLAVADFCAGPKGCYEQNNQVQCDVVGRVGDPCVTENAAACTADHRSFLRCKNQVLAAEKTCLGPKGCFIANDKVYCQ